MTAIDFLIIAIIILAGFGGVAYTIRRFQKQLESMVGEEGDEESGENPGTMNYLKQINDNLVRNYNQQELLRGTILRNSDDIGELRQELLRELKKLQGKPLKKVKAKSTTP